MSSSAIVSNLQNTNPSAIIELFTLQLDNSLHGATTIYRFHAGSSLKDNGEIVWAGNSYQRFPIKAEGFAFRKGQLPRPTLTVSNALGTITAILLSVNTTTAGNDLTGATVTRIRTSMRHSLDKIQDTDSLDAVVLIRVTPVRESYEVNRACRQYRGANPL